MVSECIKKNSVAFAINAYTHTAFSDPAWIRTKGLQLRRLLLYPAELPGRMQNCLKRRKGNKTLRKNGKSVYDMKLQCHKMR
jgi:hypothetical protein